MNTKISVFLFYLRPEHPKAGRCPKCGEMGVYCSISGSVIGSTNSPPNFLVFFLSSNHGRKLDSSFFTQDHEGNPPLDIWSGRCGRVTPNVPNKKHERNMSTQNQERNECAAGNLASIEEEIETSSVYFKPKPGKTYVIKLDPQDKIEPTETDRFKDANGKPIKRYQCKITHVNNGRQQLWDTSKTVCLQIIAELRKGFKVLRVTRTGEDRTTTYQIEGMQ